MDLIDTKDEQNHDSEQLLRDIIISINSDENDTIEETNILENNNTVDLNNESINNELKMFGDQ